mgnify:CR=1 FL=1
MKIIKYFIEFIFIIFLFIIFKILGKMGFHTEMSNESSRDTQTHLKGLKQRTLNR